MLCILEKLFGLGKKSCCGGCSQGKKLLNHTDLLYFVDTDLEILKSLDPKIVVGKVLTVEAHPNPKMTKVRVATVQLDSKGTTETICCGGTNLEVGQVVPTALVGAKLSEDFQIGVRDLRGVESRGMICARKELGLSANGEVSGEIWSMDAQYEALLGQPLCIFL